MATGPSALHGSFDCHLIGAKRLSSACHTPDLRLMGSSDESMWPGCTSLHSRQPASATRHAPRLRSAQNVGAYLE